MCLCVSVHVWSGWGGGGAAGSARVCGFVYGGRSTLYVWSYIYRIEIPLSLLYISNTQAVTIF